MTRKKEPRMLTTREFAEATGAAWSTIRKLVRLDKIPGARREQSPVGEFWLIPETSIAGFEIPSRGRPRKPLSELKGKPRRKD